LENPDTLEAIYYAFDIGRVRFIVCDSRSARSPASATDNADKTMLGATQKAWFKQELQAANGVYPLIVWVNTLPWIGVTGDDGWYLYTNERHELADFIKDNDIQGLCMISGDAHMLAIDDGTYSDYATGGGAGFPVFHAAALDQSASLKGGPYSEGAFPGRGQFGLMEVVDTGDTLITVNWSGREASNVEIVGYSFTVAAEPLPSMVCGDSDNSGAPTIGDAVLIVNYIFGGGMLPSWLFDQSDVDCSGIISIGDAVGIINYIFGGGTLNCCLH